MLWILFENMDRFDYTLISHTLYLNQAEHLLGDNFLSVLSSFLWIGVTSACFIALGKVEHDNELLKLW